MTDPALGLLMLGLIVVVIMMGFPTAFTLMGLGIFFGFIAFYVPGEVLGPQSRLRSDGPAHLWRDDQRRPDFHPVVRAHGLRDGARRAGGQDVLQHPARVPSRARVAGGRHADRVHVLGHRQRSRGRGRGADGRDRIQPDAARRLRRETRLRRDHGGRHARDPDPAFGDDHRVRRGGGPVGGQALRRGDVPRLLSGVPLSRLHHRLGDDQSEDRPASAGRADQGAGAGVGATIPGGIFAQHAGGAGFRLVLADPGDGDQDRRWKAPRVLDAVQESQASRWCRSR